MENNDIKKIYFIKNNLSNVKKVIYKSNSKFKQDNKKTKINYKKILLNLDKNTIIDIFLKKIIKKCIHIEKYNINNDYNYDNSKKIQFQNYLIKITIEKHSFGIELILHIYSINTKNNNIHIDIYLSEREANLHNVSKKIKTNSFEPKKAIELGIDICKKLNIKNIELIDKSKFTCFENEINLQNLSLFQSGMSWYQKYFGFELKENINIQNYNITLNKLNRLTINKVVKYIPEFEFITQNKNINSNLLLINFFKNRHLTQKDCKLLFKLKILEKIIKKFKLKSLKNKIFILQLKDYNYKILS